MRALTTCLSIVLALSFMMEDADAKRRRRALKKAKVARATKQTQLGIERLMGKFKWGMTSAQVISLLQEELRKKMEPELRKTADPLEQDQKRRKMMAALAKVKKSHVKFTGKRTPWDVSIVDKEFAHKNDEALVVSWGAKERRFLFFHNDRLWKQFIAFNAELFQGKSFEDFGKAMEGRFGAAERKYSTTIGGDAVMDHLAWPPSGVTLLRAYDHTAFYGNFCLLLVNKRLYANVKSGRELNSPKGDYGDPLIESVTKSEGTGRTGNEDIVDQITGKGGSGVPAVPTSRGSSSGSDDSYVPPAKTKKQRVNTSNPLEGLDL